MYGSKGRTVPPGQGSAMRTQNTLDRDWLDDELDTALRRCAPAPLSDLDGVASKTTRFAHVVAGIAADRTYRRRHNLTLLAGFTFSLVVVGATAATAGPAIVEWAGWVPDAQVERSFPVSVSGDTGTCVVAVRAVIDYATSDENTEVNLESARKFLRDTDWSALPTSSVTVEAAAAEAASAAARAVAADAAWQPTPGHLTRPPTAAELDPDGQDPAVQELRMMQTTILNDVMDAAVASERMLPGISFEAAAQCDADTE